MLNGCLMLLPQRVVLCTQHHSTPASSTGLSRWEFAEPPIAARRAFGAHGAWTVFGPRRRKAVSRVGPPSAESCELPIRRCSG